jgi:3-hydroxyacyl-[acyl-carrier-protein] dehydratase
VSPPLTAIDRIVAVEPGKEATGLRNVPNTLAIFDSHFPRFPVLPGVLIIGSMGTLAAQLLATDSERRWRLAGAEEVQFRHFVQPGDQMEITVALKERGDDEAVLSAEAKVEGKLVTRARRLILRAE